jgi:hypothetical protein
MELHPTHLPIPQDHFVNRWVARTPHRKSCGRKIFGADNFTTHVIKQVPDYSSKISFLTQRIPPTPDS